MLKSVNLMPFMVIIMGGVTVLAGFDLLVFHGGAAAIDAAGYAWLYYVTKHTESVMWLLGVANLVSIWAVWCQALSGRTNTIPSHGLLTVVAFTIYTIVLVGLGHECSTTLCALLLVLAHIALAAKNWLTDEE